MGDANEDGIIDAADVAMVQNAYGTSNADCDFNGDGKVDLKDLTIVATHQGLTIDKAWHDTVDREAMQDKLSAQTGIPNLPWYVDWYYSVLQAQKTNLEAYAYWQQPMMQELVNFCKSQQTLASDLVTTTLEGQQKLRDYYLDTVNEHLTETMTGNMAALPQPFQDLHSTLNVNYGALINGIADAVQPSVYLTGDGSDLEIHQMASRAADAIATRLRDAKLVGSVMGAADLVGGGDADKWLSFCQAMTGAGDIPALVTSFAMRKVLTAGLDRYYNSQWTPYTPDAQTWLKLYIEQRITTNDWYREMARQGFSSQYAEFLLDARQSPPSTADALTAWRRGLITDADLTRLWAINGLDPAWNKIFEVRQYNDLSLGEVKAMYEIGLADDVRIFDAAKRAGYDFNDATAVTETILQAQVRRLKGRYIFQMVSAYSYGVVNDAEVDAGVKLCGFVPLVADWIKKVGGVRKLILDRPKATATKEKLLSLGDLKAAYLRGLLTEDVFRTELLTRNYTLDDINILVELMADRRTVEKAGGKMYALSVVEMLNAWRYEVITEDDFRNKMTARGLPQDELDILIKTKKLQWSMTPSSVTPSIGEQAPPTGTTSV
jgi:hypothetical protein